MDALLRRILRSAVRRGMAGNWTWLVAAAFTFILRRALNDRGGIVSTLKIAPGEQVLISVRNPDAPLTVPEDNGNGKGNGKGARGHFNEV